MGKICRLERDDCECIGCEAECDRDWCEDCRGEPTTLCTMREEYVRADETEKKV